MRVKLARPYFTSETFPPVTRSLTVIRLIKPLWGELRGNLCGLAGRLTHTPSGCVRAVPHRSGSQSESCGKTSIMLLLLLLLLLQSLVSVSSAPPRCHPGVRGKLPQLCASMSVRPAAWSEHGTSPGAAGPRGCLPWCKTYEKCVLSVSYRKLKPVWCMMGCCCCNFPHCVGVPDECSSVFFLMTLCRHFRKAAAEADPEVDPAECFVGHIWGC